MVYIYG